MKRLIVTGDDFGASRPVNEAIEAAHRRGILTAASLMVGAPEAADAIERARRMPDLGVGLHLVLARGRPVLPPGKIPDLVDGDGRFDSNLVRAGFRYFLLPAVRRQLAAEIRAQFEAFRKTGLRLDHVNAHNHLHVHPTVLSLILAIGREYGLTAVRLPREPGGGALLGGWIGLMKRRLDAAGVRHNDTAFGIADCGAMDRRRLLTLLAGLPEGTTEVFCHPATGRWPGIEPEAARFRFEDEFAALIDPDVRNAARAVELTTFRGL